MGTSALQAKTLQELQNGLALVVVVLQQQPATGLEVARGVLDEVAQVIQPVRAGDQGFARLMAQGRQMRVIAGDVGRVAHDDVDEALTRAFNENTKDAARVGGG